jgi:quercetin dioxygenase-like cupin family protein
LAISRKRKALVREASKIEQERNKLRDQDRHIMRAEDVVWSEGGFGISLKGSSGRGASLVAPDLGFNVHNLAATFLEVPPGSEEGLYHVHGEAIKFYLEGEGVECIGDKQYPVKAGDVAFIPANVWHGTNNPGSIPFRFFAVDPSHTNPYQLHRIFTFDYSDRDPLAPLISRGS